MNLSGKSVVELINKLKLTTQQIIVLSDDIDLDFGVVRVRSKGSAGTHNGLRDIVGRIGGEFPRVRIGAGRPQFGDLASFVLSKISSEKLQDLQTTLDKVNRILDYFIDKKTVEGIDVDRI